MVFTKWVAVLMHSLSSTAGPYFVTLYKCLHANVQFYANVQMQKMMLLTFGHKQPKKFFFVSFKKTAMLQSGKGLLLVMRKKSFRAISTLVSGSKTVLPKFSSYYAFEGGSQQYSTKHTF